MDELKPEILLVDDDPICCKLSTSGSRRSRLRRAPAASREGALAPIGGQPAAGGHRRSAHGGYGWAGARAYPRRSADDARHYPHRSRYDSRCCGRDQTRVFGFLTKPFEVRPGCAGTAPPAVGWAPREGCRPTGAPIVVDRAAHAMEEVLRQAQLSPPPMPPSLSWATAEPARNSWRRPYITSQRARVQAINCAAIPERSEYSPVMPRATVPGRCTPTRACSRPPAAHLLDEIGDFQCNGVAAQDCCARFRSVSYACRFDRKSGGRCAP